MLPKGWETLRLSDIAKISSGGTPSRDTPSYWNGDIPWVRTTEVQNCQIRPEDIQEYISQHGLDNSSAKIVPANSILLAMIGQGKTRGQVALLRLNAATNQNCAAITLNKDQCPDFYFQQLLSKYQSIRDLSNSAGQSNLSGALVKSIEVIAPPLAEQTKIAKILSTWDKAITTTERLLANSQQQKQALMQQLLTGQKRFSGFADKWHEKSLKQLCKVSKGLQRNRDTLSADDSYPVINGGITPSGYTDAYNTEANTVTISEGGNSCGFVSLLSTRFWCGGHCYALLNPEAPAEFLYQLLKFNEPHIMRLRVGSGLPNIQKKALEGLTFLLPSNQAEQQKIAQALSTADAEITNLQAQLAKLKLEKKALMQQLLTGQRRVKPDADAAA